MWQKGNVNSFSTVICCVLTLIANSRAHICSRIIIIMEYMLYRKKSRQKKKPHTHVIVVRLRRCSRFNLYRGPVNDHIFFYSRFSFFFVFILLLLLPCLLLPPQSAPPDNVYKWHEKNITFKFGRHWQSAIVMFAIALCELHKAMREIERERIWRRTMFDSAYGGDLRHLIIYLFFARVGFSFAPV